MPIFANTVEMMQLPKVDDIEMDMATHDAVNWVLDRPDRQTPTARLENESDAMEIDVAPSMQPQSPDSQMLLWSDYFEPRDGGQQSGTFQLRSPPEENTDWRNETRHNHQNMNNIYGGYGRAMCGACRELINTENIIIIGCGCHYCKPCFNGYFETGLANRGSFPPRCCGEVINFQSIRQHLEDRLLRRYEDVQEEFGSRNPTYCGACGAFLPGAVVSADFKACLVCFQQTCIRCKNSRARHEEFDGNGATNLATTNRSRGRQCPSEDVPPEIAAIIKKEEWNRCPTCQHVVEKTDGCNFMECICGTEFCYGCGVEYGTDDEYCQCSDNLGDDEDAEGREEEVGDDENGEWPQYSVAVDPQGRIRCMHELTSPVNEDDEGADNVGRCHGCLREMPDLRSCDTCQLELCRECLR